MFLGGVVRNALEPSLAGDCCWGLPVIYLLCLALSGWVIQTTTRISDFRVFSDPEGREGAGDVSSQGSNKRYSRNNDYAPQPPPTITGKTPEMPAPAEGYLEKRLSKLLRCVIG